MNEADMVCMLESGEEADMVCNRFGINKKKLNEIMDAHGYEKCECGAWANEDDFEVGKCPDCQ